MRITKCLFVLICLMFVSVEYVVSAKCVFSFGSGLSVCENVNSMGEILREIRSTWGKIKISGRLGSVFAIEENLSNDNLRFVEELDLSGIGQISISRTGFKSFIQLKMLNLTDAAIRVIGDEWFLPNNSLNVLDLRRNQIESIDVQSIRHLNLLNELHLDDNLINHVDYMVFENSSLLRVLSMCNNRIQNITYLGSLRYLESLDYSLNSIQKIPDNVFQNYGKLTQLLLADNLLRDIDMNGFNGLNRLQLLNLSGNSLSQLTEIFSTTPMLHQLDVSRNNLLEIKPNVFINLRQLTTLILTRNLLSRIRVTAFAGLNRLETLHLNHNSIEKIDKGAFAELRSLKTLDLSENRLRTLSGLIFGESRLPIQTLLLASNRLDSLDERLFSSVPDVTFVSLAMNNFANLPNRLFSYVKNLQKLHLQHNSIREISADMVGDIRKVKELAVQFNRLTFPPISETAFGNLEKLTLEGNPWQCPCLALVFDYLAKNRIEYGHEDNPFYKGEKPICYATVSCNRDLDAVEKEGIISRYENLLLEP